MRRDHRAPCPFARRQAAAWREFACPGHSGYGAANHPSFSHALRQLHYGRRMISGRSPLVRAMMAVFFLFALAGCVREGRTVPVAHHGVLDLSGWDPDRDGPIELNGEWAFYQGKLLDPAALAGTAPDKAEDFLALPANWNGETAAGKDIGTVGQATLRLRILPGPGTGRLGLRLFYIKAAYVLWVNGTVLATSGTLGTDARTEVPEPSLRLPSWQADGRPLDLVLQVTNHHYREGGVVAPIRFGPAATLWNEQVRDWAISGFFAGSLLVMGVYHLVLFLFRKNSPAPLYFGLYCLLWLGKISSVRSRAAGSYGFFSRTFPPYGSIGPICSVFS